MKQIYNGKQKTTFHTFNSAFIDKKFHQNRKRIDFGNSNNVFKKCSEIYNKKSVYELVWVFMPRQYASDFRLGSHVIAD
jgi:hypothetical protein